MTTLFDFDTVFDSFFGWPDRSRSAVRPIRPVVTRVLPELHLSEEDNAFILTANVPGVSADDVALDVTRDGFTLSVKRNSVTPEGFEPVRRERQAFDLTRSWTSTVPLDPDAAEARLENGVLTVTLPKAEVARPRRLTVSAS